jgi:hypothetical protein
MLMVSLDSLFLIMLFVLLYVWVGILLTCGKHLHGLKPGHRLSLDSAVVVHVFRSLKFDKGVI